jgi:diaminopimelate epimerase
MADPEAGVPFRKGHGTENDFVLLPDPDGRLELTDARVRALCDRRRGLGADGVLRVVRTAALGEPVSPEVERTDWFMDYRNADGSLAEMCGNGIRVFARYLAEAGLVGRSELATGVPVGTRGGVRRVWSDPSDPSDPSDGSGAVGVDMGEVRVGGSSGAELGGRRFDGLVVDVGNPHLACVTGLPLDGLDLSRAPAYDPVVFPRGVNVELVSPPLDGAARMRVYERGVGETRSCGTGTVAATVAALRHAGRDEGTLAVDVAAGCASSWPPDGPR